MQNMIEDSVHRIWCEELGILEFSNDADFFGLGGHSLIMANVQMRIKAVLDIDIPMDELFRHSTVAGIGEYIAAVEKTSTR